MADKQREGNEPLRFNLQGEDAALYEKMRESMKLLQEHQTKEQEARRIYEEIAAHAQRENEMRERLQRENLQQMMKTWSQMQTTVPDLTQRAAVPQTNPGLIDNSWLKQKVAEFERDSAQSQAPVVAPAVTPGVSGMDAHIGHAPRPYSQQQVAPANTAQTPSYKEPFFCGIWDIAFPDGARYELALLSSSLNKRFSYTNAAMDNTSWGRWVLEEIGGKFPMLFITREGFYPAKFYGMLWTSDLPQPSDEAWNITGISGDTVYFPGGVSMTRRTANLADTAARIAYVQSQSKRNEMEAMSRSKMAIGEREAIMRVQAAMWGYIDRHRSY